MKDYITIIGGGLAGCEAAYQIAKVLDMQNVFDGFRIGKGVE